MPKIWRGPCAELIADSARHLSNRLHRRASRYAISYTPALDGRSAEVSRIEQRRDGWYAVPLGATHGQDVLNLWLNIALEHTPFDAELAEIMFEAVLTRAESLADDLRAFVKQLGGRLDDLSDALASVRA